MQITAPAQPLFGYTRMYLTGKEHNVPTFHINHEPNNPGELSFWESKDKISIVGHSPVLEKLETEMEGWKDTPRSEELLKKWFSMAHQGLLDVLAEEKPTIPPQVRMHFLNALKRPDFNGWSYQSKGGQRESQHMTLGQNICHHFVGDPTGEMMPVGINQ